ncbi:MAG: exosortase, partial [Deltaproteobacteria bacterium]
MHIEKAHTVSAATDHAGIGVYLAAAFLAGGFFFSYAGVFKALTGAWWNNSAYSHGFLVPVASLYIIWTERDRLKRLTPSTGYIAGFAILAIGIGMLLTGNAAGVMVIQELSIIVTLTGVALMVLGADFLKALWFPIAYLLFMLRFWDFIAARLHYPFQNFSAFLGTKLLNIIGIPAYRESIFIELPNITLKVADVCSGVNYLISVLALGIILAYLTVKGLTRSIILVCAGIVIATLANGVRVALIGTLSFYNLSGDLHGPYHVLQAMFVAAAGFAALFAGAWALSNRQEAAGPSQSTA